MELYKFINKYKVEKFKKGFVIIGNRIYSNPSEETLRIAGYKKLVASDVPDYDQEKYYMDTIYTDCGDYISMDFVLNEIRIAGIEYA